MLLLCISHTLLIIITGVATSAALVLAMHVAIEELKDVGEVTALDPITVHPAGGMPKGAIAPEPIPVVTDQRT